MEKEYVVGVDIGGQTTKIGIVDRRGNIVVQTVIGSKYKAGEAGLFIQAVCDTIRELAKEVGLRRFRVLV
jgi:glucokinase